MISCFIVIGKNCRFLSQIKMMSLKISTDIFFDGIGYFCVEKIQGLSAVVCQVIAGIVMGGFGSDQICLQKTGDRFLYREIICIFFFQNKICDLCVSQRIFDQVQHIQDHNAVHGV